MIKSNHFHFWFYLFTFSFLIKAIFRKYLRYKGISKLIFNQTLFNEFKFNLLYVCFLLKRVVAAKCVDKTIFLRIVHI